MKTSIEMGYGSRLRPLLVKRSKDFTQSRHTPGAAMKSLDSDDSNMSTIYML